MRITNSMLSNNFLADMQTNLNTMQKLQKQLTSGKLIDKASDDPVIAARSMQINTQLDANTQYNTNIKDAGNWLSTTDTALGQIGTEIGRVRDLLVSSGNAGYGTQEMQSIKDEINQKVAEISQTLNTNFDGKYIFGGTRGTDKPMGTDTFTTNVNGTTRTNTELAYNVSTTNTANEMNMIGKKLVTEVSQGVTIEYSVSASDVINFKDGASTPGSPTNMIDLLKSIVNHLDGNNADGTAVDSNAKSELTGADLTNITALSNNILKLRSEVGAKENRMDDAKTNNETETENLTTILSKTEDIDVTEMTMKYATAQTIYMACLQTSAKVIQPTLMDYLS